jgi:hypothetical protein
MGIAGTLFICCKRRNREDGSVDEQSRLHRNHRYSLLAQINARTVVGPIGGARYPHMSMPVPLSPLQ